MHTPTLLIIEDDLRLATFTRMSLETEGYQICLTMTGSEGLQQLSKQHIDLVLLDLDLPDIHGIEVCRQLRQHWQTPVIIFSAERRIETKIQALEAGANDYIVKPIDVRELLARVKVQLRDLRRPTLPEPIGQLRYHPAEQRFYAGECPLELSELETRMLEVFFHQAPGLLSKIALYQSIWGGEYHPERDAPLVETHISRLRTRLNKSLAKCRIQTVYGKGYYLTPAEDRSKSLSSG